ncbi:xanthine dehydrogenase family protein molybdopterin-binding subunit, partial [Phytoactinopolyspora endophytica]|uniref:xanthine dehydrogenase family protein molybdopterin-binding subunit n=1 Tax=Phytoactinopolyspora endophytica TaxID=1642495 RepID=UPI00197C4701
MTTATGRTPADLPPASIGTSRARVGGRERLDGTQQFLADLRLERLAHVKLVTLDVARARILSVDDSAAREVPGVLDVVTAADLPAQRFGPAFEDRPVIALEETKYHGEPVAAVVAETEDAAEWAADLVRVQHEELPAVVTLADALAPDAPLVQEPSIRVEDDPFATTNVLRERFFTWGDVDQATADVVVEGTYTFPMVTHFAIEPHGFIASADPDGGLRLWSPVQHPYLLQRMMADLFDLPLSKVRVFAPDPGGGFGGKQNPKLEPLLIHLSMRTGRPCRLVLTLEQT